MRRSRSLAAAVAAAALLAAGCTPDPQPTASPTPSPTFSCSTSTVTDPCTPEKAQKEKEQAAAVAASTNAYKAFYAEYIKVTRAGGAIEPTPTMKRYAAGPYLSAFAGYVAQIHKQKLRYTGDFEVDTPKFEPGLHRSDSPATELTFTFCVDGRQNRIIDGSGKVVGHGLLIKGTMYFRQIDNDWKIWESDDQQASRC
ncbi:hypothetical protein FHX74_001344 [Friedmanniella endophytica]|uniref:Lipoprotein n=1 Tax=Microlunatus kandeliicorticis TaxID=1759536 RepID=A0A7W3P598_9ACTN|nr:hypothetical protein [Microlunatus kandeliicorticis]MBA8793739.1 hypothetical protein [Microlunatus kandeliicorticis]